VTESPPSTTQQVLRDALGLPQQVVLAEAAVDAFDGKATSWPDLPATLANASTKRRREFLAGRHCASQALQQAGCATPGMLDIGADRLPCWPDGWLGCISHTAHLAVAIAAESSTCMALGIDVEKWMDKQVAHDVQHQIVTPDELALLRDRPLQEAMTLLFSAKETLYKALYPLTRRFRDFNAARVVSVTADRLNLALCEPWGEQWPRDTLLSVRYAGRPDGAFTALWLPAD
jgi:enterobactin synthetase component D